MIDQMDLWHRPDRAERAHRLTSRAQARADRRHARTFDSPGYDRWTFLSLEAAALASRLMSIWWPKGTRRR